MNYKVKSSREEDEEQEGLIIPQGNKYHPFMMKEQQQTFSTIHFVLDGAIKQPEYYTPLLEAIYHAEPDDTVVLRIDSYGGSVDGALAIIDALENTAAEVHCYVSGMCASAATIIALSCPNISVSPRSRWMVHHASMGSAGKLGEIISHMQFVDQHIRSIMKECYEGFLTPKEIEEVFIGKDIYMTAEEVDTRLRKRVALLNKRAKAKNKEINRMIKQAEQEHQEEESPFPKSN